MFWLLFLINADASSWAKTYGTTTTDIGHSIIESIEGTDTFYVLAGYTKEIDSDGDFSVVKINPTDGAKLWDKGYGTNREDVAYSIVKSNEGASDYYIIAGYSDVSTLNHDFAVVKIASDGSKVWSNVYGYLNGGKHEEAYSVTVSVEGSDIFYIVVGSTEYNGSGNEDVFVVKLNVDGDTLWTKIYPLDSSTDIGYSVIKTNESGTDYYLITGKMSVATDEELFVMKLNTDGTKVWCKRYGGSASEGRAIKQCRDGGYIVVGSDLTNNYSWVLKLEQSGNLIWANTYGFGSSNEEALAVDTTSDGGYIVAGGADCGVGQDADFLVVKLNECGERAWAKKFGHTSGEDEIAYSVVQTSDGGYLVAGRTNTADWVHGDSDDYDALVIKLDEDGDIADCSPPLLSCSPLLDGHDSTAVDVTIASYSVTIGDPISDVVITTGVKNVCTGAEAIELVSFDARPEKGYILLNWITEAEIDNDKWLIKRAENKDADYKQITKLHAQGVPNTYIYIDSFITPGRAYWYKLGDVDKCGKTTWHGPVLAKASPKIKFSFFLKEPAANPSTGKVRLEYSVSGYQGDNQRPITLKIYNVSGQIVKTLVNERQKPGHYTIWWDGKNNKDKKVGSGTYFCHFKANGESTRKLIRIK